MSLFGEFSFFCVLAVVLTIAFVFGVLEKKQYPLLLLFSILFDVLAIGRDLKGLLFFGGYILWELLVSTVYLKQRQKQGRNGRTYALFLVLSLLPLVLSKICGAAHVSLFQILGISYLTFKSAQVIIEIYDGVIKELSLPDMAQFLLFFPAVSSGPIDRSRRFTEDLHRSRSRQDYLELAGDGLEQLLIGVLYKFVISSLFFNLMELVSEERSFPYMAAYAYCYGLYMFFDFAGYSRMAVGAGCFFGIVTPRNFNLPFISKDIKEFWDRWHITLSYWFRDFLYSRFVMQSMRHKWFKDRLHTACAGFIVNMFVMGIWHGLTGYYILYGLYHGILLAANEIWQKKSKFYKKHKKEKWYQVLSWAVTMQLVMFGFLLFSGHLIQM